MMNFLIKPVLAQITNPVLEPITSGEEVSTFNSMLSAIITFLFIAGIIWAFTNLIIGAFRWMSGGRDKGYLQEAKDRVVHALIALVILFSVFVIMKFIGYIFDLDLLNLDVPTLTGS